jgi:hypothetical protein
MKAMISLNQIKHFVAQSEAEFQAYFQKHNVFEPSQTPAQYPCLVLIHSGVRYQADGADIVDIDCIYDFAMIDDQQESNAKKKLGEMIGYCVDPESQTEMTKMQQKTLLKGFQDGLEVIRSLLFKA